MMDQNRIKARIAELTEQIDRLSVERAELKQQLAELSTTLKVGDRVTYKGAKYVWEIRAIRPGYFGTPRFYGAKIKKDGTPGAIENEIWQSSELFLADAS